MGTKHKFSSPQSQHFCWWSKGRKENILHTYYKKIRFFFQDACLGDSGGPLVINFEGRWTLIGITSAGFGCAVEKQPGIYHKVSKTAQWISRQISTPWSTTAEISSIVTFTTTRLSWSEKNGTIKSTYWAVLFCGWNDWKKCEQCGRNLQ